MIFFTDILLIKFWFKKIDVRISSQYMQTYIRWHVYGVYYLFQNLVMFSLRPGVKGSQPWLEINEFNRRWNLVNNNKLSIDGLNYAHDFLLFPSFYVFHMTPFVNVSSWEAFKIMAGFSSPGERMLYNSHLPSKFVVIPRNAKSCEEVMEITTDPCHVS